ncbi:MAG: hypothetical protein JSR80_00330 [Verrucomicrobia bacterium]|nr:hypothetical protein [Verrucomicrobiota bacterium]
MKEKARLTLDMSIEEHMYLKMACAKLGITMRDFLLSAAFERMEELEDEWLAARARETLDDIQAGKEKVISLDELKKRIADHDVHSQRRRKSRKISQQNSQKR